MQHLRAFSVFFTQSPSFLAHQKSMAQNKGHDNARSLFGIHQIPTDNHIRDLLDGVEPALVFPVFYEIKRALEKGKHLSRFRSFNKNFLIALDGTEYFCSNQIHCDKCSNRTFKNGTTEYFHTVVTPVIVCPGNPLVIPLIPEFVVPQDGHQKQDCENTAAKCWIEKYGEQYASAGITVLGDDLYCHQPLCELLLEKKLNFILVCQPNSHRTLYEWLEGMPLDTFSIKRWKGKVYEIYNYRYVNQIPLRDQEDALLVNWCELTITRSDGTLIYKNAFATNYQITTLNVEAIISSGRTRWKVENENNNNPSCGLSSTNLLFQAIAHFKVLVARRATNTLT